MGLLFRGGGKGLEFFMQDFKKLDVWRKAHLLTLMIYRVTSRFPGDEKYGLVSQMRRCALSIPCNIAEGAGRSSGADFSRFLDIAMGSAMELDYQLLLSRDLQLIEADSFSELDGFVDEVQKMLTGLKRTIRKRN